MNDWLWGESEQLAFMSNSFCFFDLKVAIKASLSDPCPFELYTTTYAFFWGGWGLFLKIPDIRRATRHPPSPVLFYYSCTKHSRIKSFNDWKWWFGTTTTFFVNCCQSPLSEPPLKSKKENSLMKSRKGICSV